VKLLIRLVISTLAVLVADLLLRGVHSDQFISSLLVAVVLGLLNTFIRPLIILLTLPVTVVTLGLFILVINAALVLLAANIVDGFVVEGFWWAVAFSLVQWAVQGLLMGMDRDERRSE